MKKGKRRGLRKREALKIETYRLAFKVAIRHGRKYGVAGDRAEDMALRLKYAGMPAQAIRIEKDYGGHDRYASAVLP